MITPNTDKTDSISGRDSSRRSAESLPQAVGGNADVSYLLQREIVRSLQPPARKLFTRITIICGTSSFLVFLGQDLGPYRSRWCVDFLSKTRALG